LACYSLTAYTKNGEKVLDETFEATTDIEAKKIGIEVLTEKNALHTSYRCSSPLGKLLLFKP
jgi:hypothetical protein